MGSTDSSDIGEYGSVDTVDTVNFDELYIAAKVETDYNLKRVRGEPYKNEALLALMKASDKYLVADRE